MKKYKEVLIKSNDIEKIICDCCKKEFYAEKDEMEIQEMQHIRFVGGFNSIFGDGNIIECDLCQKCLANLLGKYLRINSEQG